MIQKTTLINFSIIRISFLTVLFATACSKEVDYEWKTISEITFINETTSTIIIKGNNCDSLMILPGDTLVYQNIQYHPGSSLNDKPSINNFEIFIPCDFFFDNTEKCEIMVQDIENYENVKEVESLVFELTFRFTEEKKAKAENCN